MEHTFSLQAARRSSRFLLLHPCVVPVTTGDGSRPSTQAGARTLLARARTILSMPFLYRRAGTGHNAGRVTRPQFSRGHGRSLFGHGRPSRCLVAPKCTAPCKTGKPLPLRASAVTLVDQPAVVPVVFQEQSLQLLVSLSRRREAFQPLLRAEWSPSARHRLNGMSAVGRPSSRARDLSGGSQRLAGTAVSAACQQNPSNRVPWRGVAQVE